MLWKRDSWLRSGKARGIDNQKHPVKKINLSMKKVDLSLAKSLMKSRNQGFFVVVWLVCSWGFFWFGGRWGGGGGGGAVGARAAEYQPLLSAQFLLLVKQLPGGFSGVSQVCFFSCQAGDFTVSSP